MLNHYIANGGLYTRHYEGSWQDAGTIESLLEASVMAAAAQLPARWRRPSATRGPRATR